MGSGGQAHEKDARFRIAEARQRSRPVVLAVIAGRRNGGHRFAMLDQTRASPTRDDAAGEIAEVPWRAGHGTRRIARFPEESAG
jgi:hypothetical protein